jgi:signal transduction histidine kinase
VGPLGQALTAADIEVVRINNGAIPSVLGNFTQLEQALFQVLTNAVAACSAVSHVDANGAPPSGGETPKRRGRKRRILVQTRLVERSMVLITVSDDGVGIPTQDLENIFEPFVTLRPDYGGKLWAESNEVAGATLHMQLPAAESPVP